MKKPNLAEKTGLRTRSDRRIELLAQRLEHLQVLEIAKVAEFLVRRERMLAQFLRDALESKLCQAPEAPRDDPWGSAPGAPVTFKDVPLPAADASPR